MNAFGQSVCLCMIVKDEAPVIRRCLDSVRPLIDHWLIVDTGSSDGTRDIIRAHLADLPGTLHERPWRDFAHNRSEALALARPHGDYSLIIDADDEMLVPPDFGLPRLEADSYSVDITDANIAYQRSQLVRNALPWRYAGVLHEYLTCEGAGPGGHLQLLMRRNHDGRRRRDPSTYANDVAVLETALAGETDPFLRARYTFYLAQSRRDRGDLVGAVDAYLRRAEMGYWDQEVFVSLYQAAKLMEALGRCAEAIIATYERASAACPARAEAAHGASRYCRLRDDFSRGYALAKPAVDLAAPVGGLFVETWIYDYGLLDEYAVNAYWTGEYEACAGACRALLRTPGLPAGDRERAAQNLGCALGKIAEGAAAPAAKPIGLAWRPDRPLGGTELMVEGLKARLGSTLEAIDLGINAPTGRNAGPVVVWVHHDVDQAAVQWCRDSAAVAGVARFVFVSYWQMERFVCTFGLPAERCIVIRHATEQEADLRRWAPGSVPRCAYVSTPFRGLDVLLDAWDRLPPGTADLHVWSSMGLYAGDDAPYRQLLDRAKATPGVVYHGLAPNHELRAALRTIDILTYPSTFAETACLSVIEAMAAGCRIIVPLLGALPETTAGYARVYPWQADSREHAATFAATVIDEIAAPWRGRPDRAIAQQAHCAVVYGWSRCLDEWRALIDDLTGASPPARPLPPVSTAPSPVAHDDPLAASLRRLRDRGFAPPGILDVGAHDGAFARVARRVFPDAHILMIDALDEKDAILKDVAASLGNATHLIALLGDKSGEATPFFVADTEARPDLVKTGSSMFRENTAFPMKARSVTQKTLSQVIGVRDHAFGFLKLDVQGAELAVLRGLGDRLRDIEVILLEMSLVAYNDGAPLIGAVIAELGAMGFVLHDRVEDHRYRDGTLLQIDGIFLRPDSALRPRPPFWT